MDVEKRAAYEATLDEIRSNMDERPTIWELEESARGFMAQRMASFAIYSAEVSAS
jgi:hypothetical protein